MRDQDPSPQLESDSSRELGLDDLINFGRRQGLLILLAAFLTALAAAAFTWSRPPLYEAKATLVVFPPQVTSELTPATLSVLGFQKLLESDAVVFEAKQRLVAENLLDEDAPLGVPGQLESTIFVSRRAEEQALAPMIQMAGRAKSPEVAAGITNTWAAAFLEQTRSLVSGSTAATIDFVERQYSEQRDKLAESEREYLETKVERGRGFETLSAQWLRSLADLEARNTEASATYRAETRLLLETYDGEKNIDTREEQLNAMRRALVELQVEQSSVESRLARVRLTAVALREQAKETPAVITLHKAITDDALWDTIKGDDGTVDWSALGSRRLVTEDVNPVHTDLMERLGVAEANVAALEPRAAQLRSQISELRVRMDEEEAALRADMAGKGAIQQERDAGTERLTVEHAAELAAKTLLRDRLLTEHQDETERLLARLRRETEQRLKLFEEMTESYNQAVIAKAQQDLEEVRLGAPAVPPDRALPKRLLIKAVLGGMVGLFLGTLIALVRDRRRIAKRAI